MTAIPAAARDAARSAVRAKLDGPLFRGGLLDAVANEIADAALEAAWPHRNHTQGTCACGRTPDPGICPNDHGPGLTAGGHCACVHDKEQP